MTSTSVREPRVSSRAFRQYFVAVIIAADPEWRPTSWDDFPAAGTVHKIEPAHSRSFAEGLIFSWNTRKLEDHPAPWTRWAVLVHPGARLAPGDQCYRRIVTFDGG
jgi:hypothetical protein